MPHPLLYGTSGQGHVYQGHFESFAMRVNEPLSEKEMAAVRRPVRRYLPAKVRRRW